MQSEVRKGKRITRNAVFACLLIFMMAGSIGFIIGSNLGYQVGSQEGYGTAMTDVQALLAQSGIDFQWQDLGNGQYKLTILGQDNRLRAEAFVAVDLTILHYRDGKLIASGHGAGVLMNWGKEWIEQQLSGTLNSSQTALYLGDSNDASDPADHLDWVELPNEITTNGLERAQGTYTSTGVGTWNVTYTKTATGTQSTQLWGLYADSYTSGKMTLIAADTTPSQKNMESSDILIETWQITVT